jgi:hypothetical protein
MFMAAFPKPLLAAGLSHNNNKMTKENLAKQIIETVNNYNDAGEPTIALEGVIALLDTLEPRDRESFAKWGHPHEQSTEDECWS